MSTPKRKNNISIYTQKELLERRQELLERITKSDSYLPDAILHDDLDYGFLQYVKDNFKVVTDGNKIPVIEKILTVQRWAEYTNNWSFSDQDGNIKLPFIAVIRKPDVQPGTNPSVQRTIPTRRQFHYATVPTWNGTQMGADVYRIPQPTAVDITYEVTIVCTKFRDLNKLNKIVIENFSSRQSYTSVKGHYIPIVMDSIDDNTPMDTLDGRRFYVQNYKFTMLGFLIDSEEFDVKPAISRIFIMNEFVENSVTTKSIVNNIVEIDVSNFTGDGSQTIFSVGESIGILFNVTLNGLIMERNVDYYHITKTSRISFVNPPLSGSKISIIYYKGRNSVPTDESGRRIFLNKEYFVYDGSSLSFNVSKPIATIVSFDINGLIEEENVTYSITDKNEVTLLTAPSIGSKIGINYFH